MELATINKVYFVGIGGIGMSALARYFAKRGCQVAGYDRTSTVLTKQLEQEGIAITYEDIQDNILLSFQNIQNNILVVYTPAIPKDSQILNFFIDQGFDLKKRSQVLGIISKGMYCVAIAGTHGKTTTSSMVAHILTDSGFGCTAFLGGISTNYNSNVLFGKNDVMVVEADEFDRSFLTLHPDIAVVTSMDADHLDIYGDKSHLDESFHLFTEQIKPNGRLFVKEGLDLYGITYGSDDKAMVRASNIKVKEGAFYFDFNDGFKKISNIRLGMAGRHNVENATVAMATALSMGIRSKLVKKAIESFKGVKRRFELIVQNNKHIYIDDYAHHPEELRACFDALRQLHPDKKLTAVFQPHLFTRTRDFADDFAAVLSKVDELILLEIYPARELPIEGINAQMLLDKITISEKQICEKDSVVELIKIKQPELLVTVGAGNIDTIVEPLKTVLSNV